MRTLREISEDPHNLTEEEMKAWLDMAELIKELPNRVEAYKGLEPNDNNTEEVLSERFYQENFIMYAVLESFLYKDKVSLGDMNKSIILYAPKDFVWDISVERINMIIGKMTRLGYIEKIDSHNKYNPIFIITDDGIKIYQSQTLQTLASSAFYSYHTHLLNKEVKAMSQKMLDLTQRMTWLTVASVFATIVAAAATFWSIFK